MNTSAYRFTRHADEYAVSVTMAETVVHLGTVRRVGQAWIAYPQAGDQGSHLYVNEHHTRANAADALHAAMRAALAADSAVDAAKLPARILIAPNADGASWYAECTDCDQPLGFALKSEEMARVKGGWHQCHPKLRAAKSEALAEDAAPEAVAEAPIDRTDTAPAIGVARRAKVQTLTPAVVAPVASAPVAPRASLTITHTSADGTLLEGTVKGDGAWEAIKAAQASYAIRGWRYMSSIRAIGVSHSRDRAPNMSLIERTADVLREAGFDVAVSVDATPRAMEDAEADRAARMEARAERLHNRAERLAGESDARLAAADKLSERFYMGQPILIGHHSERGARADQRRIHNHMDKFVELAAESRQTEAAATAAERHMRHRENPQTTVNRIKRLEAEQRQAQKYLDGWSRNYLDGRGRVVDTDVHAPAEGAYREQLLTQVEHLAEQLRYWREHLEQAQAEGRWNPVDVAAIRKGDLVKVRGQWRRVVRVNKTTVSVETGYSWTDKVPHHEIREHQGDPMVAAPAPDVETVAPDVETVAPDVDPPAASAVDPRAVSGTVENIDARADARAKGERADQMGLGFDLDDRQAMAEAQVCARTGGELTLFG